MSPTIQKQQFRNNTEGWLGAVVIGPKGDEKGVAVEAGGSVWLSEAEQILTANAPRQPKDNPFIPQTLQRINDDGVPEDYEVTPLEPISEDRFVPANERPIPADLVGARDAAAAQSAATGEQPVTVTAEAGKDVHTRTEEVVAEGDTARPERRPEVPPVPRAAAAAAAAAQAAEASPVDETEVEATPPPPAPPTPPSTSPHPQGPDSPLVTGEGAQEAPSEAEKPAEETAAQSPGPAHEETGAAVQPSGPPPQGEFAAQEEVGTPTAPQAPPPYTPGQSG